jgi:hypothetical protein
MSSFTKIKNSFIESTHKFTSSEVKLLLVLARHTVGKGKTTTTITLEDLSKQTGCGIITIRNNIKSLASEERKIMAVHTKNKPNSYELLKNSQLTFDSQTNPLAIDNTFTPINNTFLENLHTFNNPQIKIILTISRYTIGSGQVESDIVHPCFTRETGLQPKIVRKNLDILAKQKHISIREVSRGRAVYKLGKPSEKTQIKEKQSFLAEMWDEYF